MTTISRRQFLQFAGIVIMGQSIGFEIPDAPHFGRAFAAAPVHHSPNGPVTGHLWPDSITPLIAVYENWYQVEQGYVKRADLQPISYDPAAHPSTPVNPPAWAMVVAPSASIRAWCAADAPLVTRIGHGGVMMVVDLLSGDPIWYGIGSSAGERIGWSQASQWRAVDIQARSNDALDIVIQQRQMTIYRNSGAIARTAIATNMDSLPGGEFQITRGMPGSEQPGYHGAPWQLHWGDQFTLSGIYWHNRFGEVVPGPTIQATPVMAQWLYRQLGPDSRVTIYP
jgi:hypothetical protein